MQKNKDTFIASIFFVLGFSVVFSLLGVLLQTLLRGVSFEVQSWLSRIGGIIIIFFGLYLMGALKVAFLEKSRKINITKVFASTKITSFLFGAAFAVGWTPCVGAVLGAIFTLAVTQPSLAFLLLLSYSLGLGLPFLLVGLFVNKAEVLINKHTKWIKYLNYAFGGILVLIGIFVFVNQLGRIANFSHAGNLLLTLDTIVGSLGTINIFVAFVAGVVSFLSPCILPLLPAFLTYLASSSIKK